MKYEIRLFSIQLFLFFCIFTFIWFYTANWLAMPALYGLKWLLENSIDIIKQVQILTDVNNGEYFLQVISSTKDVLPSYGPSFIDNRTITIKILSYTYGQILLFALFFSSRTKGWVWRLALGSLLLIPSQIFGGFFRGLISLSISYGQNSDGLIISGYLGLNTLIWNGIIYFYQASILILSPLMPVIIWIFLSRKQLKEHFPFLALLFTRLKVKNSGRISGK